MRELRIVFMGTPEFAVGILASLIAERRNIVGVITAPDRKAGRGRKLQASAVKEYAQTQGLTIFQPTNLKDEAFLNSLKALNANLFIVVAFRMLPKEVWAMPKYGTFNLHASLLPNYRGAAPINWALINQETTTGVTTFFIDENIDTGNIILSSKISISENENAGTLHDKLMDLGATLVLETLIQIENNSVISTKQDTNTSICEAPKLDSENTRIDWGKSAKSVDAVIRGLSPYPGSWTQLYNGQDELKVKIFSAKPIDEMHTMEIGKVIANKIELKIAVKNGFLQLEEIQLPGKRKMKVKDLLNGFIFAADAKML